MSQFILRTNKTREKERAPLYLPAVQPVALVRWFPHLLKKKHTAPVPSRSQPAAAPPKNGASLFGGARPNGFSANLPVRSGASNPSTSPPADDVPPKKAQAGTNDASGNRSPDQPAKKEEPRKSEPSRPEPPKPASAAGEGHGAADQPIVNKPALPAQTPSQTNLDRLFRESLELFGTTSREKSAPETPVESERQPPAQERPRVEPTPRQTEPRQTEPRQVAPAATGKRDLHNGLKQLYTRFPDLPAQSAVFGVSDDGLPVLLDLLDPSPGALLVMGDEREAQMDLLQTMIASTAGRNSIRALQILIFSRQPESWKTWTETHGYTRHCLAVIGVDDESASEWVVRLADWTEQRRLGQRSGPTILLLMDSLAFLQKLTYDVRLNFDWMAKEGPEAQIWPIGAISPELAETLGPRMLRAFSSKLLGFSRDPAKAAQLAGMRVEQPGEQPERGRFIIPVGEGWLSFGLVGGTRP